MRKSCLLTVALAMISLVSCEKLDEKALLNQLRDEQARDLRVNQMNSNISALQKAAVAQTSKDCVTSITPVNENGTMVGYSISFEQSGDISIYYMENGQDGGTPVLRIKRDSDNLLYWTLNNEWLLGNDGQKICVKSKDDPAPALKIENNAWLVSSDGKSDWKEIGPVSGNFGDCMFTEVKLDTDNVSISVSDGSSYVFIKEIASHFNIPNGIIMNSDKFEDVIKGDTLFVDFIVNPSDFNLKKEMLSFISQQDIYTKTEFNPETKEYEPFDKTAHCDFEIIDLARNPAYSGAYRLALKVTGEGNFFCDTDSYLLAGAKGKNGTDHFTCANTTFTVNVIPSIPEGITIDSPQQSFYSIRKITDEPEVKPYIVGTWLNTYINEGQNIKFYPRNKIQGVSLATEELLGANVLTDSLFTDYGVLTIDAKDTSSFWKNAVAEYQEKKIEHITVENATLRMYRGKEVAELPFDYTVYFPTLFKTDVSYSVEQIKEAGNRFSIDLTEYYRKAGMNESYKHSRYENTFTDCISTQTSVVMPSQKGNILRLTFLNPQPTDPANPAVAGSIQKYSISHGQNLNSEVAILPVNFPHDFIASYNIYYVTVTE